VVKLLLLHNAVANPELSVNGKATLERAVLELQAKAKRQFSLIQKYNS
jgi:hypothetical protein